MGKSASKKGSENEQERGVGREMFREEQGKQLGVQCRVNLEWGH